VVHRERSPYGTVLVVDEGDERSLRFDRADGARQSAVLKSDARAVPLDYVRVAAAGLAFTPGRSRALVVGLGGGSFPRLLHRALPQMRVDVVEVNPVVVEVARRFFGVREDGRLRIHLEDGARFLARGAGGVRYDLVLLDAFSGSGIPKALKAPALFADARAVLAPGGALVLNVALEAEAEKERLLGDFAARFAHPTRLLSPMESGNVLAVGSLLAPPPEAFLRQRLHRLGRELGLPDLAGDVFFTGELRPAGGGGQAGR
jgi:spermidine synthase